MPLLLIAGLVIIVGGVAYYFEQRHSPAQEPSSYAPLSSESQAQNTLTKATTNAASQQSTPQPSGPSATIDQSSLTSVGTPKLSGTVTGTPHISVAIWPNNLSPSEMNSSNIKLLMWVGSTDIRNPEVSIVDGRWSTSIGNSEVAGLGGPVPYVPNGTYTVSVSDLETGKILTSGTLKITGPSIQVTQADASTVSFKYVDLPANSQVLVAGQSNNPPVVATVSGTGSSSYTIPGGMDGTYWLQVKLNNGSVLQSGPFSANYVGR